MATHTLPPEFQQAIGGLASDMRQISTASVGMFCTDDALDRIEAAAVAIIAKARIVRDHARATKKAAERIAA